MSQPAQQGQGYAARVLLGERYEIHPAKPLADLNAPLADAVAASDQRGPGREMFALVCRPDLLPRIEIIPQLSRMTHMPIMAPIEAGVVPWPETGGRRFVIVFDRNFDARLCRAIDQTIPPLREDQIVRTVMSPLMPLFRELNIRQLCHRAIRPDNLFYADAGHNSVVLGECASAPPAMSQAAAFEPIDSAIAKPSARGPGTVADDLYSFGALIAFLLSGGQAVAGRNDDEIIYEKIVRGSYATLLGDTRVSLTMMEPLRGLLCDDKSERWTVSDIEHWLGGRILSPKQPMLPPRAARAFSLAGQEYWTKPSLYHGLGVHWQAAGRLIGDGTLERWLRRALSDEQAGEALSTMVKTSAGLAESDDRLVSKALIVLEPGMPIRYKGLAARIDGLAQSLAVDFHDHESRQIVLDLIRSKLPQAYLQSQDGGRPDQAILMKTFDMMNYFLNRTQLGGGAERALYQSNRAWPCQSPLIQDQYVYEIEDFLPAIERVAQQGRLSGELVDPHIVAFCAARVRSVSERMLRELERPSDLPVFRLGVLHLLAEVQRHCESRTRYPALCRILAHNLQPVIETFHNRAYRRRLSEEMERAANKGDLLELVFLIDSVEARSQDAEGFERAKAEYAGHARGIAWLQAGGLTSTENVQAKSRQAATFLSAILSAATIVVLSLIYVM